MYISMNSSSLCPRLVQKLYVLCWFLLSSVLMINLCISCWTFLLLNMISFLLVHHHGSKMLRSESNSSITQSPIGWQISQYLTLFHEPTSGMCVCTSECVLLVLVSVCWSTIAVCERSSWMAFSQTVSTHYQLSFNSGWFSCMQLFCVLSLSLKSLFWDLSPQMSSFDSLSM